MSLTPDLSSLENQINTLVANSRADVAVALRSLDGRFQMLINENVVFHAASTMKVAVMVELFAQAELGHLSLYDEIQIINKFPSMVDGSDFSVELEGDVDHTIALKKSQSLRDLCHAMIVVSSNLATNLILQRVGVENIQRRLQTYGIDGLHILRPLEDNKAFEKGMSNTTNAISLLKLLEKLAHREIISGRACDGMLEIMKHQELIDPIPANVPDGIEVANKPGWINGIEHDAGIVFSDNPFMLVVLTRGIEERAESSALIGKITQLCYATVNP